MVESAPLLPYWNHHSHWCFWCQRVVVVVILGVCVCVLIDIFGFAILLLLVLENLFLICLFWFIFTDGV